MILSQIKSAISVYKIGATPEEIERLADVLKWEIASAQTDFSESIDFATAAQKKKPKTKKCDKGFNCKSTCISREKRCRKPLPGQFHTYAQWLADKVAKAKASSRWWEEEESAPKKSSADVDKELNEKLDALEPFWAAKPKQVPADAEKDAATKPETAETQLLTAIADLMDETENYTPLYKLRDRLSLSREAFDEAVYKLMEQDEIEFSTLVEGDTYTDEQLKAGIPQAAGGPLFFATVPPENLKKLTDLKTANKPSDKPVKASKEDIAALFEAKYDDDALDGYTYQVKSLSAGYQEKFDNDADWEKPPPPPSAKELAAVTLYTGGAFYETNRGLRGIDDDLSSEEIDFAQRLKKVANAALSQMPKYQGIVHRGVNTELPEAVLDRYRNAAAKYKSDPSAGIVTEEAYTSSSNNESQAYFSENAKFTIHSKRGVRVERFSSFPEESEVLFAAGTKFRVVKFEKEGKINHIEMEEI